VDDEVEAAIQLLNVQTDDSDEYTISITPITLKNLGSKTDLLNYLKRDELAATGQGSQGRPTYIIIRISEEGTPEKTRQLVGEKLRELQQSGNIEFWMVK